MLKGLLASALVAGLLLSVLPASAATSDAVPGELVVGFKNGVSKKRQLRLIHHVGAKLIAFGYADAFARVKVPKGRETIYISRFEGSRLVRYAARNSIGHTTA
jgi:hypothetical protein